MVWFHFYQVFSGIRRLLALQLIRGCTLVDMPNYQEATRRGGYSTSVGRG